MIDAGLEARSIVHRFVPRHLLAVDRAALTEAIERAILDAQLQAAQMTSRPVELTFSELVDGDKPAPNHNLVRCGTSVNADFDCDLPAAHRGAHRMAAKRCKYVSILGRCELSRGHEGSHLLDGNLDA